MIRSRVAAGSLLTTAMVAVAMLSGAPAVAADDEVDIFDFGYRPAQLTVTVGDPVTWTNTGNANHTVTSDTGTELDSDRLAASEAYGHVFETAGTFAYHCTIHPSMKGTVTVRAAAATKAPAGSPTPAPPSGTLPPDFEPAAVITPQPTVRPTPQPTVQPTPPPTAPPTSSPPSPAASPSPDAVASGGNDDILPVAGAVILVVVLLGALVLFARRRRS